MKITATFLDEITWDIPHQNWGAAEWDRDFSAMKKMGIDTVVMIRSGLARWLAYPSTYLNREYGCAIPDLDLIDLFLTLAEKHGMRFFCGTYVSQFFFRNGQPEKELELNLRSAEEVWRMYGKRKAFQGWYLSHEFSGQDGNIVELTSILGRRCKEISGGLPVLLSPFIRGCKEGNAWDPSIRNGRKSIDPAEHKKVWGTILEQLRGAVDIVAFQDGHTDIFELEEYLKVNRALCESYGMESWTNCESFDRDMPIKFLPIHWEKMLYKLRAAERAGLTKAITFEFSHFMSPNSMYQSAHGLYDRYCEYAGLNSTHE